MNLFSTTFGYEVIVIVIVLVLVQITDYRYYMIMINDRFIWMNH